MREVKKRVSLSLIHDKKKFSNDGGAMAPSGPPPRSATVSVNHQLTVCDRKRLVRIQISAKPSTQPNTNPTTNPNYNPNKQ